MPNSVQPLPAMHLPTSAELFERYNIPVPRYTSYPTVPHWEDAIDTALWQREFRSQFRVQNRPGGISVYVHLPFCESLCTYCGCNKRITTNHEVESVYADAVLREWRLYRELMAPERPLLRELHLGGGTPTFYSPENLQRLVANLLADADIHPGREFSFEGHPNNTTPEHLEALFELGFRRVSFGVQCNDPAVQRAISRIQPWENVVRATEAARALGYTSLNFDLVYGLPFQTREGMAQTLADVGSLRPHRIAFYSYAHVPWKSRAQRLFDEADLPSPALKTALYQLGEAYFMGLGYEAIGFDHYALPTDGLAMGLHNGTLHRNFMGYTTAQTGLLLGLGASSISDVGAAYAQNEKELAHYYEALEAGRLPIKRGCFLSADDAAAKAYILDLSCRRQTEIRPEHLELLSPFTLPELERLQADGLVALNGNHVWVTHTGRPYIRNICRAFDHRLNATQGLPSRPVFSQAV